VLRRTAAVATVAALTAGCVLYAQSRDQDQDQGHARGGSRPAADVIDPALPTFDSCTLEPADPTRTWLRPSEITPAVKAQLAGWPGGDFPEGTISVQHALDLTLPAGSVDAGNGFDGIEGVTSDALVLADGRVDAAVNIAILDVGGGGQLVPFVELYVADEEPVRWAEDVDLAIVTDGGDGAFIAPRSAGDQDVDLEHMDTIIDLAFTDSPRRTPYCTVRTFDGVPDAVVFPTGYGDGYYPTILGYGASGAVVDLVSFGHVVPWKLSGLPGTPPVPREDR